MKKLLFNLLLISGLAVTFITFKSDSNGRYNAGLACGSCHGSLNSATTTAITGLPATFETGKVYNLSVTVAHATFTKAGFNLACTGGTLAAGTGSKVNTAKTQITHTAPMTAVAGTATFNFTWTAPATTTSVVFSVVGNAVNGNGADDAADSWNTTAVTVPGGWPAATRDVNTNAVKCYPNPATSFVTIEGLKDAKNITVTNMCGMVVNVPSTITENKCTVNCANIATGTYVIKAEVNGVVTSTKFVKN
jgi:Secretion system C-terminal sorting domain